MTTTANQPTPAQARPDLKPCPHCGKPARYVIEEDHHGGNFSLGCNPGFSGLGDDCLGANAFYTAELESLNEAIARWNARVESTQQETLRKVREAAQRIATVKSAGAIKDIVEDASMRADARLILAALDDLMGRG